jgi:hypothetical protein
MAKAAGNVLFTGTIGDLSAYRMKGVDRIILRSKAVISRSRLKNHPNYDLTRRNNEEWKACIAAGKNIRLALYAVKHLADYNFSGNLHARCKSIQLDDILHTKGARSVLLTEGKHKLEGFGLNRDNTFESILLHPLDYHIDRQRATAGISVPEIVPGINLHNPLKQPLYRFIFMLGAASDIVYNGDKKMYLPVTADLPRPAKVYSSWQAWKEKMPALELSLSLNNWQNETGVSLFLSAGIEFGVPVSQADVRFVKYAGAAKILKIE